MANESLKARVGLLYISASAITLTIFTRVQVGAALMLAIFGLLILYRRWRDFVLVFFSIAVQLTIVLIYLNQMKWLGDAFVDVFKFGSLYVTGDRSTYPKPYWTILITLFLVFLFLVPQILLSVFSRKYISLIFIGLTFAIGIIVLLNRGLSPVQLLSVGFRRVWISLLIATLISVFIDQILKSIRIRKLPTFSNSLLLITAGIAEIQIWPLFDQMHSWWSATPAVILVALAFKNLRLGNLAVISPTFIRFSTISIVICIYLVTFISSVSHPRIPLKVQGYSGILISNHEGKEILEVDRFLARNIKNDSSVLNICTNGNPFFSPSDTSQSAARASVFWTPMLAIDSLSSDLLSAQPDYIVTCSFVTNPIFYAEYSGKQKIILKTYSSHFRLKDSFFSPNGIEWKIYSK